MELKHALPPQAYSDEGIFRRELNSLFAQSWLLAGRLSELQDAGSVLPVSVAGQPIVLVRDHNQRVRAFHNVCSHRGMQLVCQRQERRKTLVCPYHAWTYDLGGQLLKTPHFTEFSGKTLTDEFKERLSLKEIRTEVWLDFIMINFDASARPFADYIQPLSDRWRSYDLSTLRHAATMEYEFATNWKLIVENFLECYHVPFVHPSLNTLDRLDARPPLRLDARAEDTEDDEGIPAFLFRRRGGRLADTRACEGRHIEALEAGERRGLERHPKHAARPGIDGVQWRVLLRRSGEEHP